MYRVVLYINTATQQEYIVIVSPLQNPQDYCEPGFKIAATLEIVGDAGALPCDRALSE